MVENRQFNKSAKISKPELEQYLSKDNITLKTIFDEISIGILFLNYKSKIFLLSQNE